MQYRATRRTIVWNLEGALVMTKGQEHEMNLSARSPILESQISVPRARSDSSQHSPLLSTQICHGFMRLV